MKYPLIKSICVIFLYAGFILTGCTESFDPQVDSGQKILVVDGLITNYVNYVNLFWANSYNSNQSEVPVTDANLSIMDNLGNTFVLTGNNNGTYSCNNLSGLVGRSYTLTIIASDGTKYQSSPQIMNGIYRIDSIYGKNVDIPLYLNDGDGPFLIYNQGVSTYIDINLPNGYTNQFRFKDTLLIESFANSPRYTSSGNTYCWLKENLDNSVPITGSNISTNTSNIVDFNVNEIPLDNADDSLYAYVLCMHQYSLNKDSYNFYTLMNEQLSGGEQLFDPISVQIKGNITCISNPNITVLGKFEASADTSYTYLLNVGTTDQYIRKNNAVIPVIGGPMQRPSWWFE